MKLQLFSILDSKGEMYNPPFAETTYAAAERAFLQNQQNPETMIAKYPEDYSLWHVGDIDQLSGQITANTPHKVAQATRPKPDLKSV